MDLGAKLGDGAVAASVSIADRFERLPFTSYQRKLALALVTCFATDAVGLSMLAFLLAPISRDFGFTPAMDGMAVSAVFVGVGIGATVAGYLCDRFGRRRVLLSTMYLWGVGCLLTAFSWDFWSFSALRFITGLGLGAELPAAFALLAECMPASRRATITSWMQIGSACALTLFNVVALGAIWMLGESLGWRSMFIALFLAGMFAIYVRRHLPESPRWHEACGRHDVAHAIMVPFEAEVEKALGEPLPPVRPSTRAVASTPAQGTFASLFRGSQTKRTLFAWMLWLLVLMGYYGITMWVGKLLVDRGMSVSSSVMVGVFISMAGIPAAWIMGILLEKAGRRPVIITALLLASATAFMYGHATSFLAVVVAGAAMRFFLVAMTTTLYTYTPELFPTQVRATGMGTASTVGRVSAVAGPMIIPPLMLLWGYTGTFLVLAGCFCFAAVLVLILGPETKGRPLEDIFD